MNSYNDLLEFRYVIYKRNICWKIFLKYNDFSKWNVILEEILIETTKSDFFKSYYKNDINTKFKELELKLSIFWKLIRSNYFKNFILNITSQFNSTNFLFLIIGLPIVEIIFLNCCELNEQLFKNLNYDSNLTVKIKKAIELYKKGHFKDANKTLNEILNTNSNEFISLFLNGTYYLFEELNFNKAYELIQKCILVLNNNFEFLKEIFQIASCFYIFILKIEYIISKEPTKLNDALSLSEKIIKKDNNFLYGHYCYLQILSLINDKNEEFSKKAFPFLIDNFSLLLQAFLDHSFDNKLNFLIDKVNENYKTMSNKFNEEVNNLQQLILNIQNKIKLNKDKLFKVQKELKVILDNINTQKCYFEIIELLNNIIKLRKNVKNIELAEFIHNQSELIFNFGTKLLKNFEKDLNEKLKLYNILKENNKITKQKLINILHTFYNYNLPSEEEIKIDENFIEFLKKINIFEKDIIVNDKIKAICLLTTFLFIETFFILTYFLNYISFLMFLSLTIINLCFMPIYLKLSLKIFNIALNFYFNNLKNQFILINLKLEVNKLQPINEEESLKNVYFKKLSNEFSISTLDAKNIFELVREKDFEKLKEYVKLIYKNDRNY